MHRFDMKTVFNAMVGTTPQEELASGAQAIVPTRSVMRFSDPGTPAASDITLGLSGFSFGDHLLVYNDCAADTNVVLLAASIESANAITLASQHDLTVLMFNGTNWAHVSGTAPA